MEICKELIGCNCVENKGFNLEYYMLELVISNKEDLKVYGVEVVKKNNDESKEESRIWDVCNNKQEIKKFINKLIDNTVTPISLGYVVRDSYQKI